MATKMKSIPLPTPIVCSTNTAANLEVTGTDIADANMLGYTYYPHPYADISVAVTSNGVGLDGVTNKNWIATSSSLVKVNLLSDQDASLETAANTGNWNDAGSGATITNSASWAWHGSRSLNLVTTVVGASGAYNDIAALTTAGAQYTLSAVVKNGDTVNKTVRVGFYVTVTGYAYTGKTLVPGEVAVISKTLTFNVGDAARYAVVLSGTSTVDIYYADAIQLEAGAVATVFTLPTVTATKVAVANAKHVITDVLVSSDLTGGKATIKDGSTTKASFVIG